jgi:hypothetical protein
MKFDELDEKMRVFETALDHCVLLGLESSLQAARLLLSETVA